MAKIVKPEDVSLHPTVKIQKQLGHASLNVTGVYLDHIGAHELVEQMQDEDWEL